jgi:hypothetical protein
VEHAQHLLGVSRTASPSTTGTTWLATGNNISVKGDLTRRVLTCDIDSGVERPEERVFDRDLLPWVAAHRHALVAAGLTVLRAFLLAKCPNPKSGLKPFGGFEEWSRIVRGALVWLGEADPCQTRDRAIDDDPEREDLSRLLNSLVAVFGSERFLAKEIGCKADRAGELPGTRHIYRGEYHKGLRGWDVVVVGVLRGEELLTREEQVGELQPGDRLEVRPVIEGRLSFVSYDAEVGVLEGVGQVWASKGAEPLLDLGCHEGDAADHTGTCLEVEAALFHANRPARTELCIETLETRNSDRLDFHEVSAASVKAALLAAFEAGRESEGGEAL